MLYHHDLARVLDAERVVASLEGVSTATHRTTREWLGVGLIRTGMKVLGRPISIETGV
jgi:hypothetical protein